MTQKRIACGNVASAQLQPLPYISQPPAVISPTQQICVFQIFYLLYKYFVLSSFCCVYTLLRCVSPLVAPESRVHKPATPLFNNLPILISTYSSNDLIYSTCTFTFLCLPYPPLYIGLSLYLPRPGFLSILACLVASVSVFIPFCICFTVSFSLFFPCMQFFLGGMH